MRISYYCFITKGYIAKVTGKDLTDKCLIEFTYTLLRRKHPNFMIPVILEGDIMNAQQWGGIAGLALGDSAGGFVDFENDENFEVKCNNLYQRTVTISNYFSEFFGQFIALARAEQAEAGTAVLPIDVAINEN